MAKSPFPGFPPEALRFLRMLRRNNNREWFQANKPVYEEKLKRPMEELVLVLGGALHGFAPELVTDPKRAIFRIYRDTRFSKDKSPYKTQIAAHFTPAGIDRHVGAGLYFHISPKDVLVAAGVYMPGSAELRLLRGHIAGHGAELRALLGDRKFRKLYDGLQGEQLARPPRGFALDHPEIDLLRYKQFVVWFERPPAVAATPELFRVLLEGFVTAMPLVRYLNRSIRPKAAAAAAREA